MALPPTGDQITMSEIRNYFYNAGEASSYTISVLGTYIGVTSGDQISMSSTFGGYYFPTLP
jgi:hypothetical protein|tara:strand:+ start:5781 stop:5963 length:183 start_codon:yes stop_codon:yes gene_type:complete